MLLFGRRKRDLARVDDLERRLADLEAAQHPTRLVEWVAVMEQLRRYLQRISTVEQRLHTEKPSAEGVPDSRLEAVLRAKFPKMNGG